MPVVEDPGHDTGMKCRATRRSFPDFRNVGAWTNRFDRRTFRLRFTGDGEPRAIGERCGAQAVIVRPRGSEQHREQAEECDSSGRHRNGFPEDSQFVSEDIDAPESNECVDWRFWAEIMGRGEDVTDCSDFSSFPNSPARHRFEET